MKTLYVIALFLMASEYLVCQTPQKIIVKNNKATSEMINPELQQIFPGFQKGSIYYKGERPIECNLNYNFLLDEILFLNEKGEKMALANPQDVSKVIINDRTFIPSPKGYFEVIENGEVSLVYKWICRISKVGKEGALGISTDAPSVYQLNRFSFDAREWKMGVDEEAVAAVEVKPYLKIDSKFIQITDAKSFMKAFRGEKIKLNQYIDQNSVDFKKEADIRKLTRYGNSLTE